MRLAWTLPVLDDLLTTLYTKISPIPNYLETEMLLDTKHQTWTYQLQRLKFTSLSACSGCILISCVNTGANKAVSHFHLSTVLLLDTRVTRMVCIFTRWTPLGQHQRVTPTTWHLASIANNNYTHTLQSAITRAISGKSRPNLEH